jgi:two-component system chemotaxis sensor kinase CheA
MNGTSPEMIDLFLTEASEHLQFLREYSGILQDPYPLYEDIERLYISAHGVAGTGGTYGYELFNEVAGKLAHIFQYAMNATVSPEATAPLVEFIYEAIAVLESDLIMISAGGTESIDDIVAFKQRYPFAFQAPPPPAMDAPTEQPHAPEAEPESPAPVESATATSPVPETSATPPEPQPTASCVPIAANPVAPAPRTDAAPQVAPTPPMISAQPVAAPKPPAAAKISIENVPELEPDDAIPAEVLEFFVPEVEEHLQAITDCLLALEAHPNTEDIHRLFRAMHTIKGSAAQVGWQRIATIAHRAEDLIGRLRDGELKPSVTIIDLCLESVDVLKRVIYHQWQD